MKGLMGIVLVVSFVILGGCLQGVQVTEEGAVLLGGPPPTEPPKEKKVDGEIKPDVVRFYHRIANPGDFLTLKEDGTFFLRQGVRYPGLAPRVPCMLTLAGKWRVAKDTLILYRIFTMGPDDVLDALPLRGYPVLEGVIKEETIYLDPTMHPGDPPGILWVKRELCKQKEKS